MDKEKNYPPYLDYPKPYKPQTNADRIRAMSDEELAEFLDDTQREECESLHILNDDGTMKFESLKKGWLIWLQKPAEEGRA